MSRKIKCGRKLYDITEKDVVSFNGESWSIATKSTVTGFGSGTPVVAKAKCEKWLKEGVLFEIKNNVKGNYMKYYKFDLAKLERSKVR